MKITEKVAGIVEPKINELGFELYDVEFNKEYGSWELLISIDRPEGVSLDDCEAVSRAIEPILDEADPIEQAYLLTVSSVGIDRPLKLKKDFERNLGKLIDVKLFSPMKDKPFAGKKNFSAELISFDDGTFTVLTADGNVTIPIKQAALLRPHIDF
ncbi:MAG: ribosome maturation factor RimP [Clostridiales bacterium]|nr:ribosome maturation factor RimP [Clostridiales bacterium]